MAEESSEEEEDQEDEDRRLLAKFKPGVLAVLAAKFLPGGKTAEGDVGVVTDDDPFEMGVKLKMGDGSVTELLALDQLKVAPAQLKVKRVKAVFFAPAG